MQMILPYDLSNSLVCFIFGRNFQIIRRYGDCSDSVLRYQAPPGEARCRMGGLAGRCAVEMLQVGRSAQLGHFRNCIERLPVADEL